MKRKYFIGVAVCALFIITNSAYATIRCGDRVVSVGDLKHEVRLKCGEPYSKEVIGFIDREESKKRIRVMKIEEWIVEENEHGTKRYNSLVFEGNKLTEITSAGEKK